MNKKLRPIHLSGSDAEQFREKLLHPTREDVEKQKAVFHDLNSIRIVEQEGGFDAYVKKEENQ